MKFVFIFGFFVGVLSPTANSKRILFGVVNDGNKSSDVIIAVIETVMDYFYDRIGEQLPFSIHFFDSHRSLRRQIAACALPDEIRVVMSTTTCDRMIRLSRQCEKLGILHFALNIDRCTPPSVFYKRSFVDTVPSSDVVEAVADVVFNRSHDSDILVFHDSKYERMQTAIALLQELGSRGIRYTYLRIDGRNASELSETVGQIKDGVIGLDSIVLADFQVFKNLLDEMYEHKALDPSVSYLIVNDGWESVNPEIETPQPVHYNIDINMLLLKRKLRSPFSILLADIARYAGNQSSVFHRSNVAYLVREEVFFVAAICSVVKATETHSATKFNEEETCPSKNASDSSPYLHLWKIVQYSLQNMGVVAEALKYELLRNMPVSSRTEIFKLVAMWSSKPFLRLQYLYSEVKLLFENRTLILAMPFNPPYTLKSGNQTEDVHSGAVDKMFQHLMKHLHFNYDVLCPEDNEWGTRLSDNEWSGAINMLLKRNADLVPFLGMTKGRSQILDFTDPVMTTASGILVRKPREPPRTFIYLRPFKAQVWTYVLLSIPATSIVLYLINCYNPYYERLKRQKRGRGLFKFGNCFWYVFGAILQQGGVHLPKTVSARILVSFWWLFVLVTMASYSGNLIAFLTFPATDWPVSSLEQLVQDDSLIVYVMEGTSIHQEIHESPLKDLQLLKTRFETKTNAFAITNETTVIASIQQGRAALIDDVYVLFSIINNMYQKNGRCELAVVPNQFLEIYLSIAARKGSPYLKEINKLIRNLWHGGFVQYWAAVYSNPSQECNVIPSTIGANRRDVTVNDMQGAFYMLVLGLCMSFITVIVELCWKRRRKEHRSTFKTKVYSIKIYEE